MQIKIKVDNRETDILKHIQQIIESNALYKEIELSVENLPLGDFIISNGSEDILIIERKAVNDLLSSIKDGRYEEQSYRLNGLPHHNHNIIYLIEGDINANNKIGWYKHGNANQNFSGQKTMFYSALFSLNYFKGFSVMRTLNMAETALYICNSANKIRKEENKKPYYQTHPKKILQNNIEERNEDQQIEEQNIEEEKKENDDVEENEDNQPKNYVHVVKRVKKDNITPENIGEIMLCQIPGISSVTAIAIMEKYKSLSNLITHIQMENECHGLDTVAYENAKGQKRKINKTCIANIIKYLKN
jgi:ERCC4-type nuclease